MFRAVIYNKAFKSFSDSKGIGRIDMPQINQKDIPEFVKWLESQHDIKVCSLFTQILDLSPTQCEYNPNSIEQKKQFVQDLLNRIYICDKDGYILDSHHAYQASLELDSDMEVRCYWLKCDNTTMLELASKFPKSFKKDICNRIVE